MGDARWSTGRIDVERCRLLAEHLRLVRPVFVSLIEPDPNWLGVANSPSSRERAEAEASGGADLEAARQSALSIANLYLFAVTQHVEAIALLLDADPPPAYSIAVLSRSVIEVAARAWWLVEGEGLTARDRAERALAERLASAYQIARMEVAGGHPPGSIGVPPDVASVTREITELGFTISGNQTSVVVGGQARPDSTSLVARFLRTEMEPSSSEMLYRLYSAITHGMLGGLLIHFTSAAGEDGDPSAAL